MSRSIRPLPGTVRDPLYPESDGRPIGETEFHVVASLHLYGALRRWFVRRDDVHVAGAMFLYYEQGNPAARLTPDLMVSKGVAGKHLRLSFRTWEEGVVPTAIIELTSLDTRQDDEITKPRVYASIGVKEYFMFDPEGDYLRPRLRGYQLVDGEFELMAADDSGGIPSPELGLRLVAEDELLRLVDPATGKPLPTEEEFAEQLEAERQRAAELEAELARLRASMPPRDQDH